MFEFNLTMLIMIMTIFWYSSHPMMLCLMLILMSLMLGGLMGYFFSMWLTYSVILIFLGGMMVVFLYATTLAGAEKLFSPSLPLTLSLFFLILLLSSAMNPQKMFFDMILMIPHMFSFPSFSLIWFLILYLLLTLFIAVKFSESFKGTLMKFK